MHVCSDLKIIYLEPYVFNNSQFRDGQQYPIVFSDLKLWRLGGLASGVQTHKDTKIDLFKEKIIAGVLQQW